MDEDHGKPLIKNWMIWVKNHYFWGNIQVYHAVNLKFNSEPENDDF